MKLGIFKLVVKDCGNLAIGLGNSSVLDLVTLIVCGAYLIKKSEVCRGC